MIGRRSELRVGEEVPAANARQVLIATTWRSGSSFFGELLAHYPGVYYSYEPLHANYFKREFNNETMASAATLVSSLFKCDYNDAVLNYLRHSSKTSNNCKRRGIIIGTKDKTMQHLSSSVPRQLARVERLPEPAARQVCLLPAAPLQVRLPPLSSADREDGEDAGPGVRGAAQGPRPGKPEGGGAVARPPRGHELQGDDGLVSGGSLCQYRSGLRAP